jgi:hypothetical protein
VAYLLVLLGTPVGEAGFLWTHLATAHSDPAEGRAQPAGSYLRADKTFPSHVPAREQEHAGHARPHEQDERTGPHEPAVAHAQEQHADAHEHRHAWEHLHENAHEHRHAWEHLHENAHERQHLREHRHANAHEDEPTRASERRHAIADPHEHEPTHALDRPQAVAHAPDHHDRIARGGDVGRSFAPHEPHEHGGTVHTHGQHPVPDAELLIGSLSKFYLAPPNTAAPTQGTAPRHASQVRPEPHQVAARIDTPPPRLLG